ncbi:MAG TPA: biopolymer transporter ExbD [candidate division WOR-3 bacterium]|uniref:Biopolymer transporter ExbD n=1 Tax=candidate division WOR-3 bacterium TaxID=2052148 RepID=A0A9C9EMC4_UNCW3|nr:biopolymer transporter ExbD [candidate division WOR-3 bacterium]
MRKRRKRLKFETEAQGLILNSLVDIALSLVIGFIVTIPLFFESGIFVNTPGVARAGASDVSDIKVNIHLLDDGSIMLNEEFVTYEELEKLLPELLARSVQRKVIVSTEANVHYERVIQILDLAKQKGAGELALLRSRQ